MSIPPPPPPPPSLPPVPMAVDGSIQDAVLSASSHLTHQEVLIRRSRRLKQLAKIYRGHYWALMEDVKVKYKQYYWKYGRSPFKEDQKNQRKGSDGELMEEVWKEEEEEEEGIRTCSAAGCKAKSMALSRFCHPHILMDSKQKLYKACSFVVKSAQGKPILCGKPILRSTVPTLCPIHFQKAEKHIARALKKAGLNVCSPSKLAPKFHVIVMEFVRQIQAKRRAEQKKNVAVIQIEDDKTSQGS